jgi:UDP:flavonoid glycosyltransferase YjiC (YdhE family)
MPRGEYDRSAITRASEYEHNRDPAYVAWRAERNRENCAIRVSRKGMPEAGDYRQHQEGAMAAALSEAISETIARTRREIVAELAAEQGKPNPWKS